MKEQRFQLGDKVTYKDKNKLPNEKYFYGGTNQKGYVGTITSYEWFIEERNCYRIQVGTSITNGYFSMLESEFEEYDVVQEEPGSKFNIGDVVNINDEGYVYTDMDELAHNSVYNWAYITRCNCRTYTRSNIVVKDKVYSSVQDKWWYKFDEFCGNWTSECGISPITLVVSPMVDILVEAIRKYPVGTKYIPIPLTLNGSVYIREEKVAYTPRITGGYAIEGGIGYLYAQGKWAEIVSETESVFKDAPNIQSGSSVTSSSTIYNPITFLGVTTPTIATIGTSSWGYTDSGFSISPCSEIPLPESIQNTMPDEDIVHRENTIKAMQL